MAFSSREMPTSTIENDSGPLGRPIMTEDSVQQLLVGSEKSTQLSMLEDLVKLSDNQDDIVFQTKSPKSLWNESQNRFGFQPPQYRHSKQTVQQQQQQQTITMVTVVPNPKSSYVKINNYCYKALRAHPHVGSHPEYDWIELVTVGIATNKQRAGQLAALDQIRLWKEATGIDLTLAPEFWPMEALESKEDEDDDDDDLKPLYSQRENLETLYSQSTTLLGLVRCSPIRYDVEESLNRDKIYWTAEAETYWEGNYYFSTATDQKGKPSFLARSKKEAKKHALINLLEQNKDTPFGKAVDKYRILLESKPKVAALRIPPWKEGLQNELRASLDTMEECLIVDSNPCNSSKNTSQETPSKQTMEPPTKGHGLDATSTTLWERECAKILRYSKAHPKSFQAIQSTRENLPIATLRSNLKEALQASNVVLVQAGTGSGKSTQIPQYILEDALSSQKASKTRVLVTQPRRIAAKSLAERVAYERLERMGKGKTKKSRSVGYTVRFDSMKPRESGGSIEYVTTGILLKRLLNGGLEGISHVMIDEVHQRDLNTDLLLVLMRNLLVRGQQQLDQGLEPHIPKLVLLSATLDTAALTEYFEPAAWNEEVSIPVLGLPTKPLYPVKTMYLEDILESTQEGSSDILPKIQEFASSILHSNDSILKEELQSLQNNHDEKASNGNRIEALQRAVSLRDPFDIGTPKKLLEPNEFRSTMIGLVSELALHLIQVEIDKNKSNTGGSILCFLPGISEIKECMRRLQENPPEQLKGKLTILPLHSDIPHHEQARVFEPSKPGTIKVILSTNIAESSLTIDDVLAVIDSGLVKESSFDAVSSMTTLETIAASKESSTQRLGRVGRVAPGTCYRLYSKGDYEAMQEKATPEIQKSCLGGACLQVSSLLEGNNIEGFESVKDFLGSAMDAPPEDSVKVALEELTQLGAIDKLGKIKPLGECLVRLPLDPSIGKMLVMGVAMQCLDPLLTAASWFDERNMVFYNSTLAGTRESHRFFSETSDTEGIVRVYDTFWKVRSEEGWKAATHWAHDHGVNPSAMTSMRAVRRQLLEELCKVGLVKSDDISSWGDLRRGASANLHGDCQLLASALWCTAVPQNLAARNPMDPFGVLATDSEESARLHPSSVLFHRKPPESDNEENPVVLPKWYSFRRKVQTSSVFLRGCCSMLPEQILLFGGSHLNTTLLSSSSNQDYRIHGLLDGWIIIQCENEETVDLLIRARKMIEKILERRVFSLDSDNVCNDKDTIMVNGIRKFLDELETGRIPEAEPRAPSNDFQDYFLEEANINEEYESEPVSVVSEEDLDVVADSIEEVRDSS